MCRIKQDSFLFNYRNFSKPEEISLIVEIEFSHSPETIVSGLLLAQIKLSWLAGGSMMVPLYPQIIFVSDLL